MNQIEHEIHHKLIEIKQDLDRLNCDEIATNLKRNYQELVILFNQFASKNDPVAKIPQDSELTPILDALLLRKATRNRKFTKTHCRASK